MDQNPARIYEGDEVQEYAERAGRPLIPLTREQAEELAPLGANKRKGWMRNKPCICGSGKKFKRCCWHLYGSRKNCETESA